MAQAEQLRRTISVLVHNRPGVLARVSSLFSRRGFNIDSLAVSTTEDAEVSHMTIVVSGDEAVLEQIGKQLNKLIDVIKVRDHSRDTIVDRELSLIKVHATPQTRPEVMQIVDVFRGRIADLSELSLIVEVTGTPDKTDALLRLLRPFGIKEMVRTGKVVMVRGERE
jgi:acetolactate synthase-1/3 small subunit